jgi:DNA-binding transcriptional MerR regulator
MHASSDAPPGPGEYTIDDLAVRSGVPSRTIRFYQARGVLPPPKKRGRVAFYDDSHVERLKMVGELQDKGLRLRAIRDICCRPDLDANVLQQWLGVGERLGSISHDTPQLLTEDELKKHLGNPPPGVLARLVRKGNFQPQGDGANRRYLVESPALLHIAGKLYAAGIDLETAIALHEMLQRRLARAARELVEFAVEHVGRGFGRSAEPKDIMSTIETLFDDGVGTEAVQLIFTKEIERAVQEALQINPTRSIPSSSRRHSRR